jgi:GH25 family lysozyme M1 (1,4-beta-N-acetylmuramidase)
MAERQALGVDINEYSRTGGDNFDLVKEHIQNGVYDFLIIKAGGGTVRGAIFDEQRENAERFGILYATYHFPLPNQDMRAQARRYVDWVGTQQPAYILDIERPREGPRPPNKAEMRTMIDEMEHLTGKQPVIYSRMGILQEIGFVDEARQYRLWMAQYMYDRSHLPAEQVQYRYFHDFTRDFAWSLPQSVLNTALEENVILWQFSEKGQGPYYVYNRHTQDPEYPTGKKSADLNISIKGRDEFLRRLFGEVPAVREEVEGEGEGRGRRTKPPYPGMINQEMINLIFTAARPFTDDPWMDWIVPADLEFLAVPPENRSKPYPGPKIEALPNLTKEEKSAILALKDGQSRRVRGVATYPGKTNQDMINLFFRASIPFTDDPWTDWVMRANLEYLAIPNENRGEPYTGPRIEDLPNLTDAEKEALLANL